MRNRHWSAPGAPRGRFMLIAVPLIITMAVGLVLGIRLVSERNASLQLSAQGAASPSSTPAATTCASGSPGGTASASPAVSARAARKQRGHCGHHQRRPADGRPDDRASRPSQPGHNSQAEVRPESGSYVTG
jgi:hypothetical protein